MGKGSPNFKIWSKSQAKYTLIALKFGTLEQTTGSLLLAKFSLDQLRGWVLESHQYSKISGLAGTAQCTV